MNCSRYQFTVLPFSMSAAPQVFTKCMAVVATFLRKRQVLVFPYLDDCLVRGRSTVQVELHVSMIRCTFNRLDLLLNVQKSTLFPTQRREFIGAVLDSGQVRAFLPESRFQTMHDILEGFRQYPTITAKNCLTLLSHMASCMYVVQHVRLRLRPLQCLAGISLSTWPRQPGQGGHISTISSWVSPMVDQSTGGMRRRSPLANCIPHCPWSQTHQ